MAVHKGCLVFRKFLHTFRVDMDRHLPGESFVREFCDFHAIRCGIGNFSRDTDRFCNLYLIGEADDLFTVMAQQYRKGGVGNGSTQIKDHLAPEGVAGDFFSGIGNALKPAGCRIMLPLFQGNRSGKPQGGGGDGNIFNNT